jgi:MFS family permease
VDDMNPFQAAPQGKKMLTLIGIYLALFTNLVTSTTNSILLPAAAGEIGGMEIYPMVVAIGGVLGLIAMPLYGYYGAKNPALKRPIIAVSLLVGVIVMVSQATATNMLIMVPFGAFWGFVSASIFVLGFTVIRDMFDQKQSGTYLGLIGVIMSAAMIAGPLVGGLIIDQLGWRVFRWIIIILLAVAALMIFFGVKATTEETKGMAVESSKLDIPGAIATMAFLAGVIVPLSMTTYIPLGSLPSNLLFALAAVGLIALIFVIRAKKEKAIIPSTVLSDRNTLGFALCNFFSNFSVMGIMFFLPAYVMRVLTADPLVTTLGPALAAGGVTMLLGVAGLFLGPIFGRMIAKSGDAKPVIIIGAVARIVVIGGFLLFLNPTTPVWVVYIIMFIAGVYNSQNGTAFSAGPQIQLDPSKRVLSNSVIQMGQNLGAGVALPVYSAMLAGGIVEGMTPMLIVALVTSVILLFCSFLLKKRVPEQPE